MKTRKSWLISLVMLYGLFASASFANTPMSKDPLAINEQFHKLLKGVESEVDQSKIIYIDFMVNDKGEILVLSTSDNKLDTMLKGKLNYKTLKSKKLEYFKKYTIPVRINKI